MTPQASNRGSLWKGIGLGVALTALMLGVMFVPLTIPSLGEGTLAPLLFIGVAQILWMGPLAAAFATNQPETAKGVIIVAAVVALLNAACWGAVMTGNLHLTGG